MNEHQGHHPHQHYGHGDAGMTVEPAKTPHHAEHAGLGRLDRQQPQAGGASMHHRRHTIGRPHPHRNGSRPDQLPQKSVLLTIPLWEIPFTLATAKEAAPC